MFHRLINALRPNRLAAELREELNFHRAHTAGTLGNVTSLQDRMHDASTIRWLETTLHDVRYGLRQLRRTPVLVSTAVLSLALGIGANTAILTLINTVMLQSLPVRDPARLVLFYDGVSTGVYRGDNPGTNEFSSPFYRHLQSFQDTFEDLCAFRQGIDRVVLHVAGARESAAWERATVHLVSGNYFAVLGVSPYLGRLFSRSDDSPAAPAVAVLSYPFWRDRFRSEATAIGRAVVLNGTAFTIIGVAPPEFFGERVGQTPDFFLPLSTQSQILHTEPYEQAHNIFWLNLLGRLKRGVNLGAADAAVNLHYQQFYLAEAGASPSSANRRKIADARIHLKPGGSGISFLRYLYSRPLHLLMAVVAIVLLIACANVATLLLARASARRPEFLARLALGASRSRLVRQVLTESVLLSTIGGAVSIVVAWWSVRLLILLLQIGPQVKVRPDPLVLLFTGALSVTTGVVFGVLPALRFSRMEPRPGNVALPSKWRLSGTHMLVAIQLALSLTLLVGAGLLARSLVALEKQDLGFRREGVLIVRSDASLAGYKANELAPLYRDLSDRLSQVPTVVAASIARFTPISGNNSISNFSVENYTAPPGLQLNVAHLPVGPGFFETLGIPLLEGRTIGARDVANSTPVVVVNRTFAEQYFPQQNAVGRHMMTGAPFKAPGYEVIGVIGDARFDDVHEQPRPMAYFALAQRPEPGFEAVLRTTGAPLQLAGAVRDVFRQTDARLPILETRTLASQVEESLSQQKVVSVLCSVFGALALVLAAVGIYGTLAYSVAGRTREIAIRMAIGAQRRSVTWLILRDSLVLIVIGLAVGLPLALSATYWLRSFLFGVTRADPLALGAATLLIVLLALLAGYLPARRAARVDPMRALRQD